MRCSCVSHLLHGPWIPKIHCGAAQEAQVDVMERPKRRRKTDLKVVVVPAHKCQLLDDPLANACMYGGLQEAQRPECKGVPPHMRRPLPPPLPPPSPPSLLLLALRFLCIPCKHCSLLPPPDMLCPSRTASLNAVPRSSVLAFFLSFNGHQGAPSVCCQRRRFKSGTDWGHRGDKGDDEQRIPSRFHPHPTLHLPVRSEEILGVLPQLSKLIAMP